MRGGLTRHLLASLLLLLLPLVLLWPCLVGDRDFVPYDTAIFPPSQTVLSETELAPLRHHANLDPSEVQLMFFPQLRYIRSQLAEGHLPHWDPYARSGTALWSSSILGLWYPPNWPTLLAVDPAKGLALNAWLVYVLAGLMMYGFLSALGLRSLPALFGAVVFSLSATLTVASPFYQRAHTLIWLPGLLWATLRISRTVGHRRLPAMLGLASCMYLTWTAGFPPFAVATVLLAAAYTLWLLVPTVRSEGAGAGLRFAACTGVAALLGMGAAAVQLWPALEFFPESIRNPDAANDTFRVFDLYGLLGYLMPEFLSHPHLVVDGRLPYELVPSGWLLQNRLDPAGNYYLALNYNFVEYAIFVGTLPLFFALGGLLSRGPRIRTFASLSLLVLWFLACAGAYLPGLVNLPVLKLVPPLRFSGPACALLAVLAAIGLDHVQRLPTGRRRLLWISAAIMAVSSFVGWLALSSMDIAELRSWLVPQLLAKYQPQAPKIDAAYLNAKLPDKVLATALAQMTNGLARAAVTLGLVSLATWSFRPGRWLTPLRTVILLATAAELLWLAMPLHEGRQLATQDTKVHEFLRRQRDRWQPQGGFTVIRGTASKDPRIPDQLPPGTMMPDRIRDLHTLTFVDGRSHLPLNQLYGPSHVPRIVPLAFPDDERLNRPYFDLIGARYVLSTEPLRNAGRKVGPEWRGPSSEFFIYERETALPRAFVAFYYKDAGKTDEEVAKTLTSTAFDPRCEILLDSTTLQRIRREAFLPRFGLAPPARAVQFEKNPNPNVVELTVAPGAYGFLVLNDTFMPGWSCTVNGAEVPIYRANLFQQMVLLDPDGSRVRFSYTPPGYRGGAILSLLSLAILALMALSFVSAVRDSRRTPPTVE